MCVRVYVCLICVFDGGGGVVVSDPGVPPDCSLVYSASSTCLKGMEMQFFSLPNETDSTGIKDAFTHDMHIGAYIRPPTLPHSRTVCHQRCNAMIL